MVKGGIDSAATVFNQLKDDTTHYYVDEMELNRLGYDLLSAPFPHHNDYALEVFKINTLLFPKSGNTYDSYAQVLADNGHKDEAIAMYRKSISLWPGNEDGKKALKRLLDERN
jgi:tetratricopeptide (TPR) repeat protein